MTSLTKGEIEIMRRWREAMRRQAKLVTQPVPVLARQGDPVPPPRLPRARRWQWWEVALLVTIMALCCACYPIAATIYHAPRLYKRLRAAIERARTADITYTDILATRFEVAVGRLGGWLLVGAIAAASWVARQSRAVRLKAARARRKKVRKARKHIQALFAVERSTWFACLAFAADAYDAQQAEYERDHEMSITLSGAGLWAANVPVSRSWS